MSSEHRQIEESIAEWPVDGATGQTVLTDRTGRFDYGQGLCPELRLQTENDNPSRCGAGRSSFGSTRKNSPQDDDMVMNLVVGSKDGRNPA